MSLTSYKPAIIALAGAKPSPQELEVIAAERPLGLILFERNVRNPEQLRRFIRAFRDAAGNPDAPVLVDQEGGRVARLKPPHFTAMPPAAVFGRMARDDFIEASAALHLAMTVMAHELRSAGITVNCAPVLDVSFEGAHGVIGDRAYSDDPALVARLGRIVIDSLLDGGVLPVIKHIPGHGRARADSHQELPFVEASMQELCDTDFPPFQALADAPMAMTAHIVYAALDETAPATLSRTVIEKTIRGDIGFGGFLLSDDLCMDALDGPMSERATAAIEAGCDAVLVCSGDLGDARSTLAALPEMSDRAAERYETAVKRLPTAEEQFDVAAARERLEHLMSAWV